MEENLSKKLGAYLECSLATDVRVRNASEVATLNGEIAATSREPQYRSILMAGNLDSVVKKTLIIYDDLTEPQKVHEMVHDASHVILGHLYGPYCASIHERRRGIEDSGCRPLPRTVQMHEVASALTRVVYDGGSQDTWQKFLAKWKNSNPLQIPESYIRCNLELIKKIWGERTLPFIGDDRW